MHERARTVDVSSYEPLYASFNGIIHCNACCPRCSYSNSRANLHLASVNVDQVNPDGSLTERGCHDKNRVEALVLAKMIDSSTQKYVALVRCAK